MATNMYMKIETPNVVGESTDSEHIGQMEIQSYSHGESQPTSGTSSSSGARTTGKVSIQDFVVTKFLDKASPVLNLACCDGTHYKTITIQLFRATSDGSKPVKYMEYILTDAIISTYRVSASGGDVPTETLAFNFATIKWSYVPQKKESPGGADAAIASGWSLIQNKKI